MNGQQFCSSATLSDELRKGESATTMAPAKPAAATTTQTALDVDVIKQFPGPQQFQRAVKVNVSGKHFPQLQPAEQAVNYEGTAVEHADRHKFAQQHGKAWGAAHTGPGIRFGL